MSTEVRKVNASNPSYNNCLFLAIFSAIALHRIYRHGYVLCLVLLCFLTFGLTMLVFIYMYVLATTNRKTKQLLVVFVVCII